MSHIEHLQGDPEVFLEKMVEHLYKRGFSDCLHYEIDHICYRVACITRYEQLKAQLCKTHELVLEELVGGRPIALFRLTKPLEAVGHTITGLELPAPKAGNLYSEGYEHAEFVVENIEKFIAQHQTLSFKASGIDSEDNPTISLAIPGFGSVKFHEHHIFTVVQHRKMVSR